MASKKTYKAELLVGLAFMAATAMLGFYTIAVSKVSLSPKKRYVVEFDRVFGLKEGDPVRVEGFEKGEVKSLTLREGKIRAILEVESDVDIYRTNSEVKVTPFSPLGGRVVEIDRGLDSPRGKYTYFGRAKDAVASEDQADKIPGLAEGELLQTLNELVETNKEDVRTIVSNLKKVSDRLAATDNVVGYLVNDADGGKHAKATVEHLSSASARVDRLLAKVEEGQGVAGGLVKQDSPLQRELEGTLSAGKRTFDGAAKILERADEGKSALGVLVGPDEGPAKDVRGIVADVKVVTGRIAAGEGTLGKLSTDARLYDGATAAVENIAAISSKMNSGKGILGVLAEEQAGEDVRATLRNLASITGALDDPEGGTLGMLVHDQPLRRRIGRVTEEVERLLVDFRDALEDTREQAPVNAFIGAVFAAF